MSSAASGSCWWIRRGGCWACWWSRPTGRSSRGGGGCWRRSCRSSPACSRSGRTKGIAGRSAPGCGRRSGGSWRSSCGLRTGRALSSSRAGGWWREPSHTTEQDHESLNDPPCAIIGLTGLLRLVEAVERVRAAQASRHAEGAEPCLVQSSALFPPAQSERGEQSLGAPAASPPPAAADAPEPPPGAATAATAGARRGGRR